MAKQTLFEKYKSILKSGKISESEIVSMRSWIKNASQEESREIFDLIYNNGDGIKLTGGQVTKGFDWLKKQMKTPTGKIKESNPFGYREMFVLENRKDIVLHDLYDAGNMFSKFYIPVYEVQSKSGETFTYHTAGGKINIIG